MADLLEYIDAALVLGGGAQATELGSLNFSTEWNKQDIQTSGTTNFEKRCILGKKPMFNCTLIDPSFILPTGLAVTANAKLIYRSFEANGGLGGTYKSLSFAKALIVPKSLSVDETSIANLTIDVLGIYDSGSCLTVGSTSIAPATVTKCWVLDNVTIGSATLTDVESVQNDWNFNLVPRPVFEPESYHYDQYNLTGNATIRDLGQMDKDNLLDGKTETVTLNFKDREGGTTLALALGSCDIEATVQSGKLNISWTSLG